MVANLVFFNTAFLYWTYIQRTSCIQTDLIN